MTSTEEGISNPACEERDTISPPSVNGRDDRTLVSLEEENKTPHYKQWNSRFPCCVKKSYVDLTLVGIVILGTVIAVIVIACLQVGKRNTESGHGRDTGSATKICTTSECVRAAAMLMEAMDMEADPCGDFFQYACGRWNRRHLIPEQGKEITQFTRLYDVLQILMKGLLERSVNIKEPNSVQKAKRLYQACRNETLVDVLKEEPVWKLLTALGGWPVLNDSWNASQFHIEEEMAKFHFYTNVLQERTDSNKVLLKPYVAVDRKNSSSFILAIDQPDLGLPSREHYLGARNTSSLRAYETYAVSIAMALGASESTARTDMADVVDFEIRIANATDLPEQRRDEEFTYNKLTVAELSTNATDKIDWRRYLETLCRLGNARVPNVVVVEAIDYMRKLGDILQETPPRTIANYLVWRVLKNLIIALPKEFQQLQEKFKYAVDGTTRMYSRWYRCVTLVNDNMGLAVGRLFVEKYFDEESKTEALDMIHKIRNAFVNNVKESVSWMDEKTKEVATEKAATMLEKIGYPPYVLNNKELNANYEQLTISADNYFENMLACFRHTAIHDLKQLSLTPNRTRWEDINIVMVNAAYSPNKNQILFSAGMLQPPFYSKYYPRSMNFGGIGMVIGHEITHGLDDQGRLYDKNGNLREWWDETTSERFKEKARCFIEQYGNYTVEDVNMKINGKLTQGENIADNGGLKQAFQAYRNWVSKRGQEEERLPGLNMSHNQIFFLSFAHMLCGHQRPKSTVDQIRTDTHTTLKYRVIGSLSNSAEFAAAFQCPAGSPMNPSKKCVMW